MVKIKDLSDTQLKQQLEKHSKIIRALRKEREKRLELADDDIDISVSRSDLIDQDRVRKTGTISNIRISRAPKIRREDTHYNDEKTNSNIYKLSLESLESDEIKSIKSIEEKSKTVQPRPKQVTVSRLIEISQDKKVKSIKEDDKKAS